MPPRGYRSTTETEIKRSRFLTTIARTDTEAEARALIAQIRCAHPNARHNCTAFILDDQGIRSARSSDDGEPAGTAGIPMLTCLTGADLVNVTAVVTRYFGGIKLGAGGLTRAYGGCVADAVSSMPRMVRQELPVWIAEPTYADAGRIQEELVRCGAGLIDISYTDTTVRLRFWSASDPIEDLARATQGALVPRPDGVYVVEVPLEESHRA